MLSPFTLFVHHTLLLWLFKTENMCYFGPYLNQPHLMTQLVKAIERRSTGLSEGCSLKRIEERIEDTRLHEEQGLYVIEIQCSSL